MVIDLWKRRDLIGQFTRREIAGRYRGSYLGLLWSFVNPLFMLAIYTFVFGLVFQSRWPQARTGSLGEFAVTLFCGLAVFNVFSECVARAPALIVSVPNYVRKVVFPLEILPVSTLGSGLFHGVVNLIILAAANLAIGGALGWNALWFPVVFVPLILLTLGLSWMLAALGVYVRDVQQIVSPVLMALFFATPIFYPMDAIPEALRGFMRMNPLAAIVDSARRVMLYDLPPDWPALGLCALAGVPVLLLGYAFFSKTRKGFADVL